MAKIIAEKNAENNILELLVFSPAQKRIIRYTDLFSTERNLYLSFPSILFKIEYFIQHDLYEFYRLKCVFTDSNLKEFYLPCLLNVDRDGRVCLGSNTNVTYHYFASKQKMTNAVIDTFWNSSFNHGGCEALVFYLGIYCFETRKYTTEPHEAIYNFMLDWQKNTKTNPDYIPILKKDGLIFPLDFTNWNFNENL